MTRNKAGIIITALAMIFFISCTDSEPEWQGVTEEIDGIKVVKNPAVPLYPDKIINFTEDLSIGVEEGDENDMLITPLDIDADSDGNIYVLDWDERTIKKYDSQGKFIQRIGRKGQGPGELEYPRFFCISNQGNIYVQKAFTQVEVFNLDGEYQKTLNFSSLDNLRVTPEEKLIVGYSTNIEGEDRKVKRLYKVGVYDAANDVIHDFYKREQFLQARLSDGEFTLEYPQFVKWDIDSDSRIFLATASRFEIQVFSVEGALLYRFGMDFDPIKVTGEARQKVDSILNRLEANSNRDYSDVSKLVEFYPVFRSLSLDEKDRIWMKRYRPYWRDKPVSDTTFDVFSKEGQYIFTTAVAGDCYPELTFKNGYAYSLIGGESGYAKAVRFKIREN